MDEIIIAAFVIIMVAAFVLPIAVNKRRTRKQEQSGRDRILGFARDNNLSLDHAEVWRNRYFLGLDSASGKLVYSGDIHGEVHAVLDLGEARSAGIHEDSRRVGRDNSKVIDRLFLELHMRHGRGNGRVLLYDGDVHTSLQGELDFLEKWKERINSSIRPSKRP